MSNRENYNPLNYYSEYLDIRNRSDLNSVIKNNWSPSIEKELITELKSPIKKVKSPEQSQYKSFCLLIGVLGLLSIGLCVQADTITQNLRKIARVSVEQIIRINSQ